MKKYLYILVLMVWLPLNRMNAQEDSKDFMVSISPQHLIMSGLRVELEPHLLNKAWLTIAPTIYLNHSNNNRYNSDFEDHEYNNTYNKLTGLGIDIAHKVFLFDKGLPFGPYFSYGFGYQHFILEYEEYVFYPTAYDGLNVERYGLKEINHTIDKMGINIILGYHYPIENIMFIDLYIGVGLRYSFQDSNYDANREYNGTILDFGYTGTLPVGGFKCGFVF